MTPEQTVLLLRSPLQPAHGIYEVYRRLCDAAATIIEQNETIISELQVLTEPPDKAK